MREYQTLPGRMHPQMNMQTSGGYLLRGIYVGGPSNKNKLEDISDSVSEKRQKIEVDSEDIEKKL